jgi:hypothetical protein
MLEKRLKRILDGRTGERGVSRFLAKYPEIVRWAFCDTGGHSTYVVREFPFGSRYKADFVVPTSYSGQWEVHLIELEPPTDPVVNKDGTPSHRLNKALTQLQDWNNFIGSNPVSFRKDLSDWCVKKDKLGYCSGDSPPCNFTSNYLKDPDTFIRFYFHIVIGRRERIDNEKRRRMNLFSQMHMHVDLCTYGRFIDIARNHDKHARDPDKPVLLTESDD